MEYEDCSGLRSSGERNRRTPSGWGEARGTPVVEPAIQCSGLRARAPGRGRARAGRWQLVVRAGSGAGRGRLASGRRRRRRSPGPTGRGLGRALRGGAGWAVTGLPPGVGVDRFDSTLIEIVLPVAQPAHRAGRRGAPARRCCPYHVVRRGVRSRRRRPHARRSRRRRAAGHVDAALGSERWSRRRPGHGRIATPNAGRDRRLGRGGVGVLREVLEAEVRWEERPDSTAEMAMARLLRYEGRPPPITSRSTATPSSPNRTSPSRRSRSTSRSHVAHATAEAFGPRAGPRRQNRLARLGWVPVRFPLGASCGAVAGEASAS